MRASLRTLDEPTPEPTGWWLGQARAAGIAVVRGTPRLRLVTPEGQRLAGLTPAATRIDPDVLRLIGGCADADVDVRLRRDPAGWTLLAIRCGAWTAQGWVFPGLDRLTRNAVAHAWADEPRAEMVTLPLSRTT